MDTTITLLRVGVEGGELKLVLEMNDAGVFSYRLATDSCFNEFLNKDDQVEEDGYRLHSSGALVIDWAGAVRLLDESGTPWLEMHPQFVHPSISSRVETLLKERYKEVNVHGFSTWIGCIKRSLTGE